MDVSAAAPMLAALSAAVAEASANLAAAPPTSATASTPLDIDVLAAVDVPFASQRYAVVHRSPAVSPCSRRATGSRSRTSRLRNSFQAARLFSSST